MQQGGQPAAAQPPAQQKPAAPAGTAGKAVKDSKPPSGAVKITAPPGRTVPEVMQQKPPPTTTTPTPTPAAAAGSKASSVTEDLKSFSTNFKLGTKVAPGKKPAKQPEKKVAAPAAKASPSSSAPAKKAGTPAAETAGAVESTGGDDGDLPDGLPDVESPKDADDVFSMTAIIDSVDAAAAATKSENGGSTPAAAPQEDSGGGGGGAWADESEEEDEVDPAAAAAAAEEMAKTKLHSKWSIWERNPKIDNWADSLERFAEFDTIPEFWKAIFNFGKKPKVASMSAKMPPTVYYQNNEMVPGWTISTWFTLMRNETKPIMEGEKLSGMNVNRFQLKTRLAAAKDVWTLLMLSLIGERFRQVESELDVCGLECKADRAGCAFFYIWWLNPGNKLDATKIQKSLQEYVNTFMATEVYQKEREPNRFASVSM